MSYNQEENEEHDSKGNFTMSEKRRQWEEFYEQEKRDSRQREIDAKWEADQKKVTKMVDSYMLWIIGFILLFLGLWFVTHCDLSTPKNKYENFEAPKL